MPIKKENKALYPANWKEIREDILARAQNKCEFCGVRNHIIRRNAFIVLTIAHMDHRPENCAPENLKALCQLCHNQYDAKHRAENRAKTLAAKKAQLGLFGG